MVVLESEDSMVESHHIKRFYLAALLSVVSAMAVSALVALMDGTRSGVLVFSGLLMTTLGLLVADGLRDRHRPGRD